MGKSIRPVHSIICGMGEIGTGLKKILEKKYLVYGIDKDTKEIPEMCQFLNICIPYSDKFVEIVNEYIGKLLPELTIIHSTVYPGTTKKINGVAVHSPVMGKHCFGLEKGLNAYAKFVGWDSVAARETATAYLSKVFNIKLIEGTLATELMKVLSLTRYGLYLSVADEMKRICDYFGQKYEVVVKEWEREYNKGMKKFEPDRRRPIYDPPNGFLGGHCTWQVMQILTGEKNGVSSPMVSKVVQEYTHL